jgi:hypothetical protein
VFKFALQVPLYLTPTPIVSQGRGQKGRTTTTATTTLYDEAAGGHDALYDTATGGWDVQGEPETPLYETADGAVSGNGAVLYETAGTADESEGANAVYDTASGQRVLASVEFC